VHLDSFQHLALQRQAYKATAYDAILITFFGLALLGGSLNFNATISPLISGFH
jgi:hypothetical protein